MNIKKGDQVIIIAGNYKDKKGQVLKVLPKEGRVVVEKVAIIKTYTPKSTRAKRSNY